MTAAKKTTHAAGLPRDTRYDYTTCAACERPSQNIDTGTMPSGERVCGFCLRLSIGRTFAWLRETRWARSGNGGAR